MIVNSRKEDFMGHISVQLTLITFPASFLTSKISRPCVEFNKG